MSYFIPIVSFENSFDFVVFLLIIAVKLSILLGFIYVTCQFFQRLSAANKHLIWLTGLCTGLLLPFLATIDSLQIPIFPTQTHEISQNFKTNFSSSYEENKIIYENLVESSLASIDNNHIPLNYSSIISKLSSGIILFWLLGMIVLSVRLAFGFVAIKLHTKQATTRTNPVLTNMISDLSQLIKLNQKIEPFYSKSVSMPIVYGLWNSKVLLTEEFETWSEEKQRAVLLHELAHIKRRDCLTQLLAQIVCIVFWFNPFVWLTARHLRILRELACDDYVLNYGTKPSVYAGHLLEMTKMLQNKSFFDSTSEVTLGIARKSQVETRLLAILNSHQSRWELHSYVKVFIVFIVIVFSLPLSALQLKSQTNKPQNLAETIIFNEIEKENADFLRDNKQINANKDVNSIIKQEVQLLKSNQENRRDEKVVKPQTVVSKIKDPPLKRLEKLTDSENQIEISSKKSDNSLGHLQTPLSNLQNNLRPLEKIKTDLKPIEN